MKVVSLSIEEQVSKSGKSYYALYIITDEKENNKKLCGYVNSKSIKFLPLKDKEN